MLTEVELYRNPKMMATTSADSQSAARSFLPVFSQLASLRVALGGAAVRTPNPRPVPTRSRTRVGIDPEPIPTRWPSNPEPVRDQVGISACKSFRFRDQ